MVQSDGEPTKDGQSTEVLGQRQEKRGVSQVWCRARSREELTPGQPPLILIASPSTVCSLSTSPTLEAALRSIASWKGGQGKRPRISIDCGWSERTVEREKERGRTHGLPTGLLFDELVGGRVDGRMVGREGHVRRSEGRVETKGRCGSVLGRNVMARGWAEEVPPNRQQHSAGNI